MPTKKTETPPERSRHAAVLVAAGIFASRIVGLVRQRVISHYFGISTEAADAWAAGFRIPNLLQNLFGEGALSASFIPVYSRLLARGERERADRVAAGVGALLALTVAILVLVGVTVTPWLIGAVAPGFTGSKRALTIHVVRILFPGAGLLVLSAWCLGILNSHRRFFLSYAAPIVWSVAMIVALVWYGGTPDLSALVLVLAWASVVGSVLQVVVQLPVVLSVAPHVFTYVTSGFRTASGAAGDDATVGTVIRNFVPAFISRGVVQLSAYIDTLLASLLPTGAVAGLMNAQTLYTLPVSLFGISVSAAELPAMSGVAQDEGYAELRHRLERGLRQIAFFVVPSSAVFLAFGDVTAAALFQTGRFVREDSLYVWGILAGSAVGLLASTHARLYASALYALRDTRTPLRFAMVRVVATTVLGYLCAIPLPALLAINPAWGAAGLTASAGIAGWIEMGLLRRNVRMRVGAVGMQASELVRLWSASLVGVAVGWSLKWMMPMGSPIVTAGVILGAFGVIYLASTWLLGVPAAVALVARGRQRST
ncbi:MAG: murein biosynthesis integral membrane protein MurJ [Acidobacteriaceae bacterium]|nr:murein biosynthesis integral membrane protein MurJ [Acidobacteriaceae bacterium]